MNDLEIFFNQKDHKQIRKWQHYFDVYDRYFSAYRGKPIHILEIGVSDGGSLQMWKAYFGPQAKIYGVDIDPACKALEEPGIEIFIGSQTDKEFLRKIKSSIPQLDILIDDGGHTMRQQIVTFEELFGHVKADGVYLIEDLHTSYWANYGGGSKRRGTFIEYSKHFIDQLNAFHTRQSSLKITDFTRSVDSLHYHDSILVIEKKHRTEPVNLTSGIPPIKTALPKYHSPLKMKLIGLKDNFLIFMDNLERVLNIRSRK